MIHFTLMRCGGKPPCRFSGRVLGAVLITVTLSTAYAADDPYLQMLDEEVTKVDGVSTDTVEDDAVRPAQNAGTGKAQMAPSRKNFEASLREEQVGTYSFYRRLPERSREEVFVDYSNGASMESLREKVIDRFLHP